MPTCADRPMRIALGLEYDGRAVLRLAVAAGRVRRAGRARARARRRSPARRVGTIAAGRTDAGVHATIAGRAFRHRRATRPTRRGCAASMRYLPPAVAVLWAQPVAARIPRALRRRARATTRTCCSTARERARRSLAGPRRLVPSAARRRRDARRRARALVGTHDFSAFRAAECQAKSPVQDAATGSTIARERRHRPLRFLAPTPSCTTWSATSSARWSTSAPARQPPAWIAELLAARDRTRAAPTFAPDGLYLTGVDYDAEWGLPPTRRPRRAAGADAAIDDACARASRSAASRASTTRSPRRTPARTRSASSSGPARRAASSSSSARAIVAALPPFVTRRRPVRRSASPARCARRSPRCRSTCCSSTATRPPALCRAFGRPYLKAVAVQARASIC